MIQKLAGSEHEVLVHDMHQEEIAHRAAQYGVKSVPAVVIDGKLTGYCAGRGVEEGLVREALENKLWRDEDAARLLNRAKQIDDLIVRLMREVGIEIVE